MSRITIWARVGSDGVLHLPLGVTEANQQVRVTIEHDSPAKESMTQAEYAIWVDSLAGSWHGDFERPPQGELQERDPL